MGTDGEIYILKGAVDIDHRTNIDEEIRKPRNTTIKTKAKKSTPKPGNVVVVNQGGLFDNIDTDTQPSELSAEDFTKSIIDLMS